MRAEPSLLAQLVISYHEKFGRHVPESALRLLTAGNLAAMLQDALATNVQLAESGWGPDSPFEFSPRGCCIILEEPEHSAPTMGPDGELLQ
jgi:hypothetical protein